MKNGSKYKKKKIDLTLEKDIQKEIHEAINNSGLGFVWRQNSGKARGAGGWVQMSRTGSGDLTGVTRDGKRLEVEIKRPGEKQRPEQMIFEGEMLKWNAVYILAWDVEGALAQLRKHDLMVRGLKLVK